jgi:hypothetical protein
MRSSAPMEEHTSPVSLTAYFSTFQRTFAAWESDGRFDAASVAAFPSARFFRPRPLIERRQANQEPSMAEVELPDPDEIKERGASPFTKMVALSTAVIAVVLAIASVGGSNAGKDMMKEQIEASNQWARYQAKAIRERMAEQEIRRLQLEASASQGDASKEKLRGLLNQEIEYYAAERKRYKGEKEDIEKQARESSDASLVNQRRDGYFDTAEMLLQIAIVMASVAMLADSRLAFGAAAILAVCGAVLAFNGFTLKFKIDLLEPEHQEQKAEAPKSDGKHAWRLDHATPYEPPPACLAVF